MQSTDWNRAKLDRGLVVLFHRLAGAELPRGLRISQANRIRLGADLAALEYLREFAEFAIAHLNIGGNHDQCRVARSAEVPARAGLGRIRVRPAEPMEAGTDSGGDADGGPVWVRCPCRGGAVH